jgi:hypothetical protein
MVEGGRWVSLFGSLCIEVRDLLQRLFQLIKMRVSEMSESVEGFGCRLIAAMRLAPWPASESLH